MRVFNTPGYESALSWTAVVEYESDPLWPLIDKGISDLVENQDLIEQEDRNYIVGYLCKVILKGRKKTTAAAKRSPR